MRPVQSMIERTGSRSSRHHVTSVVSPNVQIMAMPDPFSGSASWCASTGTSASNSGVRTVVSKRAWYRVVVGMRDERDARREELGARRLDDDRRRRAP